LISCATRSRSPDDLLDREAADNGPQVPGEHPANQDLHPVLLGQETAGGIGDGRRVIPDLECRHGPDVKADALLGDAVLDNLRFAQGQ
jgi:hypothetical protein